MMKVESFYFSTYPVDTFETTMSQEQNAKTGSPAMSLKFQTNPALTAKIKAMLEEDAHEQLAMNFPALAADDSEGQMDRVTPRPKAAEMVATSTATAARMTMQEEREAMGLDADDPRLIL